MVIRARNNRIGPRNITIPLSKMSRQSRKQRTATAIPLLPILALLQLFLLSSSIPFLVTSECITGDLVTSLQGNTGSYGNMFELVAKKSAVRITQLDFYTDVNTNVTFHLWSKSGSYLGFETDEGAWNKHTTGTTQGEGVGKTTPIPREFLAPFDLAPGTRMAFVLALVDPDVRYDMGTAEGQPWRESEHLVLTQGKGVAQFPPFPEEGTFYAPRVFNGKVTYELIAVCDSERREQLEAEQKQKEKEETTFSLGGGRGGGVDNNSPYMPPAVASPMVELTYKFSIFTSEAGSDVEQDSEKVVRQILDKSITDVLGYGYNNHKDLMDLTNMSLIDVMAKVFNGINQSTDGPCRTKSCHTLDIRVQVEHTANSNATPEEIRYFLLLHAQPIEEELLYEFVEYLGPKPADTKKVMALNGVSWESFNDSRSLRHFEKTVKQFLAHHLYSVADIARVKINTWENRSGNSGYKGQYDRSTNDDVRHRYLQYDGNYETSGGRDRKHTLSSSNLGITITGEYQPPPDIDFAEKTQESFENDAGVLVEMLQLGDPTGHFKNLASISSLTDDGNVKPLEPREVPYKPQLETENEEVEEDDRGSMQSDGATGGKSVWDNPKILSMYIIAGIVVGALVFAMWTRLVRGDEQSDEESRDMSYYPDSIYSVLKERAPMWLGGSNKTNGTARRPSAFTAPTGDVIVKSQSRHSMYSRNPDNKSRRQFPRSVTARNGSASEFNDDNHDPPRQFPHSDTAQSGFASEFNNDNQNPPLQFPRSDTGQHGFVGAGEFKSGSFNTGSSGQTMSFRQ